MQHSTPFRKVCRKEATCSCCGVVIRKGERISTLFNYYACKNKDCEVAITERYHQAKINAKLARV